MNDFKHYRGRGRGQYQHNNYRGQNYNNVRRANPNAFGPLLPLPHFRDNKHRWQRPPQHQHQPWRGRHSHPPPYMRGPPPGYPPNPLVGIAPRPQSPLPGSEEARQKAIAEASARIKQQLNLTESETGQTFQTEQIPGSNFTSFSDDVVSNNFAEDIVIPEAPKQEKSVKKRAKKPSESSVSHASVEELRNKILNQFTTMSKGKITSLVNNPGCSKYDNYLQHLVRDMRLHLSSELRNMYNNRENDSNNSIIDHLNSIVPDLGVELVNLPDTMVAELSKILQFDVNNEIQDQNCSQINTNDVDNVLVQPEDMFKEAEQLLLNTDFESNYELNEYPPLPNMDVNISPDSTGNFLQNSIVQNEIQSDPFINRSPLCNEPPPNLAYEPGINLHPENGRQQNIFSPELLSEHRSFPFPLVEEQNINVQSTGDVLETTDMDIDDLIDENLAADEQQNIEPVILEQNSTSNLDEIPLPDSNESDQFPEIAKSPVISRDTSPFSKKLLEANLPDSTNILDPNFENRQSRSSSIPLFQTQSRSNSPPAGGKFEFRAVSLPSNSSNHATHSNSPFSMRSEASDVVNTKTAEKPAANDVKIAEKFNFESIFTFKPKIDTITNVTSFLDDVVSLNICDSTKNDTQTPKNNQKQIETVRPIEKNKFDTTKNIQKQFPKPKFVKKNSPKPKKKDLPPESPKNSRLSLDERIKMMILMQQSGNNSKKTPEEQRSQQQALEKLKQQVINKAHMKKMQKKQRQEENKIKVKVQVGNKNTKSHPHGYLNKYQEMISNMPPDPKPDSSKSDQQVIQPVNIVIKQEKLDPEELPENQNTQNRNIITQKEINKAEHKTDMKSKSPPTKAALKDLPPISFPAWNPSVEDILEKDAHSQNNITKKVEYTEIPGVKIKRKEIPTVEAQPPVETTEETTTEPQVEEKQNNIPKTSETTSEPTKITEIIENMPSITVNEPNTVTEKELIDDSEQIVSKPVENIIQKDENKSEESQEIITTEKVPEILCTTIEQTSAEENKIQDIQIAVNEPEKDLNKSTTQPEVITKPVESDVQPNQPEKSVEVNQPPVEQTPVLEQQSKEKESTKKPKTDDKKHDKPHEKDRKSERSDSRNDKDRQRHKSKEKDSRHKSQSDSKKSEDRREKETHKRDKPVKKPELPESQTLSTSEINLSSVLTPVVVDIPSIQQQIALETSAQLLNNANQQNIIQRLIEIDLQIQKLMSEKFNLYQQLNLSSFNFNSLSFYSPVLPSQIFEDDEDKKTVEKNKKTEHSEDQHHQHHHHHHSSSHHRSSHSRKVCKRSETPVDELKKLRKRKISESSTSKTNENDPELDSEVPLKKKGKPDKKPEPKKAKTCANKDNVDNSKKVVEHDKEPKKIEEKLENVKEKPKIPEIVEVKPIEQVVDPVEVEKLEKSPKKRRKKPNITQSTLSEELIDEPNKKYFIKIKKPEKKHDKPEPDVKVEVPVVEIEEKKVEPPEKPKAKRSRKSKHENLEETGEKTNNNRDTPTIEEPAEEKQESNNNENKSEYKIKVKHETSEKIKLKIIKSEIKDTEEKPNNRKSRRLTEEEPRPLPPTLPTKTTRRKRVKEEDTKSEDRSRSRSASKEPETQEETSIILPSLPVAKPKTSRKKKGKEEDRSRSRSASKDPEPDPEEETSIIVPSLSVVKPKISRKKKGKEEECSRSRSASKEPEPEPEEETSIILPVAKSKTTKKKRGKQENITRSRSASKEPELEEEAAILPSEPVAKSKTTKKKRGKQEDIKTEDSSRSRSVSKESEPKPEEDTSIILPNVPAAKPKTHKKKKGKEEDTNFEERSRSASKDLEPEPEHEPEKEESIILSHLPVAKSRTTKKKRGKQEEIKLEHSRSRSASKDPEPDPEEDTTILRTVPVAKSKTTKKKTVKQEEKKPEETETINKNSDSEDEALINRKRRKVPEKEENSSLIEEKKSVAKRKRKDSPDPEETPEEKAEPSKPVPEKLVKNCFVKLERIEITTNTEKPANNEEEISDSEFHEIMDNIFDKYDGANDSSLSTVAKEDTPETEEPKETVAEDKDKQIDEEEDKEEEENTLEIDKLEEGIFCTGHHKSILDIKILGNDFLAASEDGTIYKYSLITGELHDAFTGHMRAVTCINVVHGSRVLDPTSTATLMYSGSLDCTLKCFNIDTAEVLDSVKVEQAIQCMDVAWGNIFLGTYEGLLFIYNIKKKVLNDASLTIANATVLMIKATTEGSRQVLILASRKREIMVRDAFTGLLLRTMCEEQKPTIYSLLLDKSRVYCGTSDKGILILDFHNGSQTNVFNSGKGVVCMIMYKSLLFAGCYDGLIYVYNTKNNKHITTISGPGEGMLLSLAITDGLIIAGTKKDHLLKIWRIPQDIINQID